MSHLIDDLLSYSQISVRPGQFEKVSLEAVVKNVLNDLEVMIEQKRAKITVGHIGEIFGHEGQLTQAFQNIISNALKFQKPGTAPEIQITTNLVDKKSLPLACRQLGSAKEYYRVEIADNGIGFDPEESERIFNVFTRLHGNSEYMGTGIGLSIVKKVVENHNGCVVSESEPGKGAKFILFFPLGK